VLFTVVFMNIKKNNRLNTKEIRYIIKTKKKKFLRWKIFNINIIKQFPWMEYNKFWISISSKFHKRAVYRNILRKLFFHIIYQSNYIHKRSKWSYVKVYVALKKGVVYDFKKENIKDKIKKDLENDLDIIFWR